MEPADRRAQQDRRKKPTPALSRYTLFGQRKGFRRKEDQKMGGYTDRYSSVLLAFLVLMVGLNILDALFTTVILDQMGWEINPVVRSVIALHGDRFWIWKFLLVSFCAVVLCLHSKFRLARHLVLILSSIYLIVVIYQLLLLAH